MKTNHVPEFELFRPLYQAPDTSTNVTEIQKEARMYQIMAEPPLAQRPQYRISTRTLQRTVAAGALTFLGLGGATAAAASGYANPVGDSLIRLFGGRDALMAEPVEVLDQQCAFAFTMEAVDNSVNMAIAEDALARIDLANIPGAPPVINARLFTDEERAAEPDMKPEHSAIWYTTDFDPEFEDAVRQQFRTELVAVGLEPDAVKLVGNIACTADFVETVVGEHG